MATRILVIGNPGSGKSTLLNTAIGDAKFSSGLSIASGIIPEKTEFQCSSAIFADSPGLADVEHRTRAAQMIGKQLCVAGNFKILFVLKLDNLRLRPEDIATVNIVLQALASKGYDADKHVSIVLNQLYENEIKELEHNPTLKTGDFFEKSGCNYKITHHLLVPMDMAAVGETGALLANRQSILFFLLTAPMLQLRGDQIEIPTNEYEAYEQMSRIRIKELEDTIAYQDKAISERERTHQEHVRMMESRESLAPASEHSQSDHQKKHVSLRRIGWPGQKKKMTPSTSSTQGDGRGKPRNPL